MPDSPADRLELHLAREFLTGYIRTAMGKNKSVVIDPNKLFTAARFSGLKVRAEILRRVLDEMQRPRTDRCPVGHWRDTSPQKTG